MDTLDAFIVNLHLLLGHDKTAAFIGAPAYNKAECALCHPELVGAVTQHAAMRAVVERAERA